MSMLSSVSFLEEVKCIVGFPPVDAHSSRVWHVLDKVGQSCYIVDDWPPAWRPLSLSSSPPLVSLLSPVPLPDLVSGLIFTWCYFPPFSHVLTVCFSSLFLSALRLHCHELHFGHAITRGSRRSHSTQHRFSTSLQLPNHILSRLQSIRMLFSNISEGSASSDPADIIECQSLRKDAFPLFN